MAAMSKVAAVHLPGQQIRVRPCPDIRCLLREEPLSGLEQSQINVEERHAVAAYRSKPCCTMPSQMAAYVIGGPVFSRHASE